VERLRPGAVNPADLGGSELSTGLQVREDTRRRIVDRGTEQIHAGSCREQEGTVVDSGYQLRVDLYELAAVAKHYLPTTSQEYHAAVRFMDSVDPQIMRSAMQIW
jgi:hypothetical protein